MSVPVQCGCGARFNDTESFVEHYDREHQIVPSPQTYGHAEAEYVAEMEWLAP